MDFDNAAPEIAKSDLPENYGNGIEHKSALQRAAL